jgi:hypothetical protein
MRKRGNVEETEISFGQELSTKNKIQATRSLAVPVLKYSFGIIHWCQAKLQKLDGKRGNCLSSMDSITQRQTHITWVLPQNRGRGLMQLEDSHIVEITKMLEYASSKVDPLIQIIRTQQHIINSILLQTAR